MIFFVTCVDKGARAGREKLSDAVRSINNEKVGFRYSAAKKPVLFTCTGKFWSVRRHICITAVQSLACGTLLHRNTSVHSLTPKHAAKYESTHTHAQIHMRTCTLTNTHARGHTRARTHTAPWITITSQRPRVKQS